MTKSDMSSGNASPIENAVRDHKQVAVKFLQLIVAGTTDEAYLKLKTLSVMFSFNLVQ